MSYFVNSATQPSKEKPCGVRSFFETLKNNVKTTVTSVGANALSQLLTSEPVARGAEMLLLAHPVSAVNSLHQTLKKTHDGPLDWDAFCALQVQFQAFAESKELAQLELEQRTFICETNTRLMTLRKELENQSKEQREEGLSALCQELPELTQRVGILVEKGSLTGRVATVVGNVLFAQVKQVFPFLFSTAPAVDSEAPIPPPPSSLNLNGRYLAVIEKDRLAKNGAGFGALRFACEAVGGLSYDVNRYRTLLASPHDELKTNVLKELRAQNVSWIRYFCVWCLFSLVHSLIARYVQRAADAYFREAFTYLKDQKAQKYEPLIHTTLENGAQYFFSFNAKLARGSNLKNEEFQKDLELPHADELYEKMGADFIRKSGMNCVFVKILTWVFGSPKELAKSCVLSFTEAMHEREYGFNRMLFPLLGYAENFVRAPALNPPSKYTPTRERMRHVEGFVRNLTDAALMASCKTPAQVTEGITNRRFSSDFTTTLLAKIPSTLLSEETSAEFRQLSQEEVVQRSIISLAELIEQMFEEQSLQYALYEMLAAGNTFFTSDPPVMTPEQLDLAVRQRAVNLFNLILTTKLQLPEEAGSYFTEIIAPYVDSFLTLGSNSLQPALLQRIFLDPYLKNR